MVKILGTKEIRSLNVRVELYKCNLKVFNFEAMGFCILDRKYQLLSPPRENVLIIKKTDTENLGYLSDIKVSITFLKSYNKS